MIVKLARSARRAPWIGKMWLRLAIGVAHMFVLIAAQWLSALLDECRHGEVRVEY